MKRMKISNPSGCAVPVGGQPERGDGILGFWLGNYPVRDRYLDRI